MRTVPRHQRPSKFKKFLFGAPYYPEHWTEEVRKEDAQRMEDAGVNVIRMTDFAWDVLEPEKGVFDFSLFRETIDEMGRHGIDTILCTPTAGPPRWMTYPHQHWMRMDDRGQAMISGNRQHICTNNLEFRAASKNITRAMAEAFKDHPHVIGWQTDNELYCHVAVCYCQACQTGFQDFLEAKYGNIQALNRAWGARFWAQTYDYFQQIELPRGNRTPAPINPSHALDHQRYLSYSVTAFQKEQIDIFREVCPHQWVTHNGIFGSMDHWKFSEELDFFSVDVYPGFGGGKPDNYTWAGFLNERCRHVTGSYLVPEQSGGAGGQNDFMLPTSEPGQMRLWAYQSVAHGADGILHFRWRTCRFGAEIYWNGIIDHDNVLRRRYHEFAQEGLEFKALSEEIIGSVKEVQIGILTQYDNEACFGTMPNKYPKPLEQAKNLFVEGCHRHLSVGLLHPEDSFMGMKVILIPSYIIQDTILAKKCEDFVRSGGVLFVTGRTFTRDADNQVIAETAPGALSTLLGITREEEGIIEHDNREYKLILADGRRVLGKAGYEVLQTTTAQAIAHWTVGEAGRHVHAAEGHCAMAVNKVGAGEAYYFGSYAVEQNVDFIYDTVLAASGVEPMVQAHPNVETTIRHRNGQKYCFILNHMLTEQTIGHVPMGTDLISGNQCEGEIRVESLGVRVIKLT